MGGDGEAVAALETQVDRCQSSERALPAAGQVRDEDTDKLERRPGEPAGEPGCRGARAVIQREVPLLDARARHEAERRLEAVAHPAVAEKVVPRVIRVEQTHARRRLRSGDV